MNPGGARGAASGPLGVHVNPDAALGGSGVRDPLDLAVFAAAITAACAGFLWWNAKPARIIMGDQREPSTISFSSAKVWIR